MPDLIINVEAGTARVLPVIVVPDDLHAVTVQLPDGAEPLAMAFELSWYGEPFRPFGSIVALGATLNPLPLLCALCSNEYLPGDPRYEECDDHSSVGFRGVRSYHVPVPLLPAARLFRITVTPERDLATVLTVTVH